MIDEPIIAEPEGGDYIPPRLPAEMDDVIDLIGRRPACRPGVASPRDRKTRLARMT